MFGVAFCKLIPSIGLVDKSLFENFHFCKIFTFIHEILALFFVLILVEILPWWPLESETLVLVDLKTSETWIDTS